MSKEPSDLPVAGDIIAGKYEVERVLGAGGMGVVLAARHVQLGQRVAVKFMRPDAASDAGGVGRFLREARAAAALSSEHVTRVLDVGTLENGAPYMVMEYLAGADLGATLKQRGPMPVADAVTFLLQACEAIAEAHSLGIVHRDLKPSNIFVGKNLGGQPLIKVLDFGISKTSNAWLTGEGDALTASGSIMGSPSYMSPELVRSAKDVDARSDVWALGVVLFEMLSASLPFEGNSLGDTLARILTDAPRRIESVRPEVPAGLAAIVSQCMEKSVERRIQSVGELARRLLPFAGPEGPRSVERILHVLGAPPPPREETLMATETLSNSRAEAWPKGDTGPAWLRSASRNEPARSRRGAVIATIGAGFVAVAMAGTYMALSGHARSGPTSAGAASAPLPGPSRSTVQPVAPSATVPPAASEGEAPRASPEPSADSGPVASTPKPPEPARPAPRGTVVTPPPVRKPAPQPLPSPATSTTPHETDVF